MILLKLQRTPSFIVIKCGKVHQLPLCYVPQMGTLTDHIQTWMRTLLRASRLTARVQAPKAVFSLAHSSNIYSPIWWYTDNKGIFILGWLKSSWIFTCIIFNKPSPVNETFLFLVGFFWGGRGDLCSIIALDWGVWRTGQSLGLSVMFLDSFLIGTWSYAGNDVVLIYMNTDLDWIVVC